MIRSLEHYAALILSPLYAFWYPTQLGYYRLFLDEMCGPIDPGGNLYYQRLERLRGV